jgi:phenylalanyl-tRNA synthetase alpha chain
MAAPAEILLADASARIAAAPTSAALEDVRVAVLGRSAPLTLELRGIGALPPAERGPAGKRLNEVRVAIEGALAARAAELARDETTARLAGERIDVTLPGAIVPHGGLHLLTQVRREVEDIFIGLGYGIAEGPEIELEELNFTRLNIPDDHPAKAETDTLWITDGVCLRTHTSPVQARVLSAQPPPIAVIVPGRVYRRDTPDATHSPIFHQVEGLVVDRHITLADLKGTLEHAAHALFGADRRTRFRTSFFPFTEPSVELDVACFLCDGRGCGPCKGSGWLEMLGAGEVDPNVLEMAGLDPEEWSGFAFGMGIERIAMLRHGLHDLRDLYEDDLRFLEQFPS